MIDKVISKQRLQGLLFVLLNLALGCNNLFVSFFADFYPCPSRFLLDLGCGEPEIKVVTILDSLYDREEVTENHSLLVRHFST